MEQIKTLSLVESLAGIPMFDQILAVLESKKFIVPEKEKKADDVVISEMSPLERAIYTVLTNIENTVEETLAKIKSNDDQAGLQCFSCPGLLFGLCSLAEDIKHVDTKEHEQVFLGELMFALINSRILNQKILSFHSGIRSDFTVVSFDVPAPEKISTFAFENASLEEMLEMSIKGSFLEDVQEYLEKGQFMDIKNPMEEDDIMIRELLPFEKALCTYKESLMNKLMGFDEIIGQFEGKDPSERKSITDEMILGLAKHSSFEKILVSTIVLNTPKEKTDGFDGLAIRTGFKVVGC